MEEPVVVENNFAQNLNNNTGFPFDDSDYDSSQHFQSRLDDITARHPEFASHLRDLDDFPSLRRKRQPAEEHPQTSANSPGSSAGPSGTSHRFPSTFGRFPFSSRFDDDDEDFVNFGAQKPPEVPKQEHKDSGKRGRKANPNLPQHLSNTVDLGQPSVAENRNQRSMSAPPENRNTSPRVEPNSTPPSGDMGKNYSRQNQPPPQQQQPPKERIIPIHVEGRDVPVMPKNPNIGTEKVFGGEKVQPGFPSAERARQNDPHAPYRRQMYEQFVPKQPSQQNQQFGNQQFTRQQTPPQRDFSRQQTPPQKDFSRQQTPPHQQAQSQHVPQQATSQQAPPRQQATPPPRQQATPPPMSNDPLDKIKCVRNDVMELMTKVENFVGTRKDREYLYLDEMLTRNLLKLDDVETEGKENIRLARKEAIKCIQTCINNLEAKAQAREAQLRAEKAENMDAQKEEPQETEQPPLEEEQPVKSEENTPQALPDQSKESSPPKFTSQATLIISPPQKQQKIEDQPSETTEEKMEIDETNASEKTAEGQMETEEKTNEPSQTK